MARCKPLAAARGCRIGAEPGRAAAGAGAARARISVELLAERYAPAIALVVAGMVLTILFARAASGLLESIVCLR